MNIRERAIKAYQEQCRQIELDEAETRQKDIEFRQESLQREIDGLFGEPMTLTFGQAEDGWTYAELADLPGARFVWARQYGYWDLYVTFGDFTFRDRVDSLIALGHAIVSAEQKPAHAQAPPVSPKRFDSLTLGQANTETRPFKVIGTSPETLDFMPQLIVEYTDVSA